MSDIRPIAMKAWRSTGDFASVRASMFCLCDAYAVAFDMNMGADYARVEVTIKQLCGLDE